MSRIGNNNNALVVKPLLHEAQEEGKLIEKNHQFVRSMAQRLESLGEALNVEEQQKRLLQVTEQNIENHRNLRDYMEALQRAQGGGKFEIQSSTHVALQQERYYLDLQEDLGIAAQQDDEMMVVGGTQKQNLTCPITTAQLVDPVRSKICKHAYSREAILAMLGRKPFIACPVTGCANRQLNKEQLEEDVQAKLALRHAQKRKEQRPTQVLEDSDEEA